MAAVRNIYEQQAYNNRMTVIIVVIFVVVLASIGFAIDVFLLGIPNEDIPLPLVTLVMVSLAIGRTIWSLQSGWKAVLRSMRALRVNPKNPLHKQLLDVVEEMKIAAGTPMPAVFVIPDVDCNALTAGRDPQHSAIAVTDGLLKAVNREELQAVIAHEMSHIRNYDIRLTTILASLIGAFVLLVETVLGTLKGVTSVRTNDLVGRLLLATPYFIAWLIAAVITPGILKLIATAVSRNREYLADATAAELTRNPAGLASALKKVGSDRIPTLSMRPATAHMCIVDPTGSGFNDQEGFVAELFGTHPPLLRRIRKLEAMAYVNAQSHNHPQQPVKS